MTTENQQTPPPAPAAPAAAPAPAASPAASAAPPPAPAAPPPAVIPLEQYESLRRSNEKLTSELEGFNKWRTNVAKVFTAPEGSVDPELPPQAAAAISQAENQARLAWSNYHAAAAAAGHGVEPGAVPVVAPHLASQKAFAVNPDGSLKDPNAPTAFMAAWKPTNGWAFRQAAPPAPVVQQQAAPPQGVTPDAAALGAPPPAQFPPGAPAAPGAGITPEAAGRASLSKLRSALGM